MSSKPTIKLRPTTQRIQTAKTNDYVSTLPNPYYRPKKIQISIRMDADILAWFKNQPGKYQQLINKACRMYMQLTQ